MASTTMTQVPPAVRTFYDRTLLVRALPELVHNLFGQHRPIPMNSGDQIKFRRYNALDVATAPLTEGVTPDAVQLSKTDITASLAQYGNLVKITDMVEWTNQDKVLTETATLLGENAGQSLDQVMRSVLIAGTNVRYSSGDTDTTDVQHKLTDADLDIVTRALHRNNAKKFTRMIKPVNKYASVPMRAAYWAIIHPDTLRDLDDSVTDFTPVHEYASHMDTYPQEVGGYRHIRMVMSTYAKVWADSGFAIGVDGFISTSGANNDVYGTLVFAKDAYGTCPLSGHALENIRKPRGLGTDSLDQYSTSGWKATTVAAKILDDNFMYRIEHACTD